MTFYYEKPVVDPRWLGINVYEFNRIWNFKVEPLLKTLLAEPFGETLEQYLEDSRKVPVLQRLIEELEKMGWERSEWEWECAVAMEVESRLCARVDRLESVTAVDAPERWQLASLGVPGWLPGLVAQDFYVPYLMGQPHDNTYFRETVVIPRYKRLREAYDRIDEVCRSFGLERGRRELRELQVVWKDVWLLQEWGLRKMDGHMWLTKCQFKQCRAAVKKCAAYLERWKEGIGRFDVEY